MKVGSMKKAFILLMIAHGLLKPSIDIVGQAELPERTAIGIFAHGLGATGKGQSNIYTEDFCAHPYPKSDAYILMQPFTTFDFPDAKNDGPEWHSKKVNLGQEMDMMALTEAYEETVQAFPDKDILMCGVSRGAVTILNCMASNVFDRVKAIVVESPFDTLDSVVEHLIRQYHLSWIPFSRKIGMKLCCKKFPSIDLKGIFPIKVVNTIPTDLPIFLIHSRQDQVIPTNSSRYLYLALIESGHTNVYYLEIANGEHARILCAREAELYQNVVHAFYEKFNLPHTKEFAHKGRHLLPQCQPTAQAVRDNIKARRAIEIEDEEEVTDPAPCESQDLSECDH